MKKILFKITALYLLVLLVSCDNPITEVSDEVNGYTEDIMLQRAEALAGLKPMSVDSVITNNPEIDVRGGIVEFQRVTEYLQEGQWLGGQFSKSTLSQYKIFAEIVSTSGSNKVYVYGYDDDYNDYSYVRKGTQDSYVSSDDLSSNEEAGYIGAYAFSAGQVTVKFSYERIEDHGSADNNSGFTAEPIDVSPGNGVVGQTYFNFKVRITSGTANSAIVDFYAPDGEQYNGFQLPKSGTTFNLSKKLSQVGTYYYRYVVNSSSHAYVSQWKTIIVESANSSEGFSESCMETRYSNCSYARSDNAFYASNSSLAGQCTWYTYGRVVELSDKGELSSGVKQKMSNAFWGKSGRHAKNWPGMMNGNWTSTNSAALPAHKRKKGLIAVWQFGDYGHVGFVEEISSDGSMYRLSDFNRGGNTTKRDRWYSFTGTSDRLGGVYPSFLDPETL